jgi:trans-2,3-dihydro-3-hydroxyanthranilate isomerase
MKRRYVVADVFTDTPFLGNPVAVVLDAQGMNKAQMQQVAVEFGYSETTFVLPPDNPSIQHACESLRPRARSPSPGTRMLELLTCLPITPR